MDKRPEIDRWILSELHTLIEKVDAKYDNYEPTKATRLISSFVIEDLSNWYVRLSRRRFWKGVYEADKIAAYQTLYTCLVSVAKLMAPIAPFYADRLYQDLDKTTAKEQYASVHLAYFPGAVKSFVDPALEEKMQRAQRIVSLVLSIRKKEKIKVRQPLQRVLIPALDRNEKQAIEEVSDLIAAEVNVKTIEILDDASSILVKEVKPNFKSLGPRFGKEMRAVSEAIFGLSEEQIQTVERDGSLSIEINGKNIILDASDVIIQSKDIAGWSVASEQGVTVALDCSLTEDLLLEGIAREFVNRIQNLRKDMGFEVTDTIDLTIKYDKRLVDAINSNESYVASELLAKNIEFVKTDLDGKYLSFDDIETLIYLEKNK